MLPKSIRDRRRWKAGTELLIEERPDGVLLKAARKGTKRALADLVGILKYEGPARTVEEMDAAMDEEFKRRHARGRC